MQFALTAGALGASMQSVGEQALVAAVLGTGAAQESLVPALMRAYAAADHVVGYAMLPTPVKTCVQVVPGGAAAFAVNVLKNGLIFATYAQPAREHWASWQCKLWTNQITCSLEPLLIAATMLPLAHWLVRTCLYCPRWLCLCRPVSSPCSHWPTNPCCT